MRRRISWLVVATTSAVVVSFVIPLCLQVRTLAQERAMAAADQEARNVAIIVAGLHDDPHLAPLVEGIDARNVPTVGVLTPDGDQLGGGGDLGNDPEVRRALDGDAFTVVDHDGGRVLVPVVMEEGTYVVRAAVTPHDLYHGVTRAWTAIIGLGALLLVAAVAIAGELGRRISEPLREVAATAHRLREGDFSARAEVRGTEETRELAYALNGLAERTVELLATERAVVGDLAHRLRTPVTALRLDAEAVTDPELTVRLQTHIAVLQRTIDAIVREARRPVRTDLAPECDARAVVSDRAAFWAPLAEDQARPLQVRLPSDEVLVPLAADDLSDLLDILVDNVFAHTPEGTALRIDLRTMTTHAGTTGVVLTVADAGPGFSTQAPRRAGSTGLGLDIATRTARGCGGDLTFGQSPEGGVQAHVRLPLAPAR
ncbi:MAG: HAMP domain-containing histidine kinase [Micrococcales bacterium]|nr:HAMP domain-containing histidine kinase [Micrococcales bacterium]